MKKLCATLILAVLASCVSIPTPSGRPELTVSVSPSEAKTRIADGLSRQGWMVTASDDLGVTASCLVSPSQQVWIGSGEWRSRFNLRKLDRGTYIQATCWVISQGASQDVSTANQGYGTQEFLESVFSDVIVGPRFLAR